MHTMARTVQCPSRTRIRGSGRMLLPLTTTNFAAGRGEVTSKRRPGFGKKQQYADALIAQGKDRPTYVMIQRRVVSQRKKSLSVKRGDANLPPRKGAGWQPPRPQPVPSHNTRIATRTHRRCAPQRAACSLTIQAAPPVWAGGPSKADGVHLALQQNAYYGMYVPRTW
jgi:hypothetical protein